MELEITPEPSDDERAAIAAALSAEQEQPAGPWTEPDPDEPNPPLGP